MNQLLTTGQAAKFYGVQPDTIRKWIKNGKLNAGRTMGGHHRIDKRDLERDGVRSSFVTCWQELNGGHSLL
ncbi:MAG: excisionase family DNA-binding protein [Elusimicrobia bacterium]|nr:excisionase family DNA-binding protein [Elusimicrobiota bacterium]